MHKIITASVAQVYQVTEDLIKGKSKERPLPEARRMIAYIMSRNGYDLHEIASEIKVNRTYAWRAKNKIVDEIILYDDVADKYEKCLQLIENSIN